MAIENTPVDPRIMQEELEKDSGSAKKTSSEGIPFHYLKKGITQLRVMPPFPGQKKWFREFREHPWSPGGQFRRDVCPTNIGEPCPICEEGKRLYQSNDPDKVIKAGTFRPRRAFVLNAVVLTDPDGPQASRGVQVLRFGVKVKRQLVRYDRDFAGEWGEMTDLFKGFDVRIEKTGDSMETTEYFVHGVPKRTNIADVLKAQNIDFASFNLINLDEILPPTPYETLQSLLKEDFVPGFSNTPTVVVTDDSEETEEKPKVSVAPVVAPQIPNIPAPFTTETN